MARSKHEKWVTREGLILLEGWARDGLSDEQIASNMGISTATLYNYKKKYLEILEALKRGKEVADYEVENALFKSALGYEYIEVTKERIVDSGQKKRHNGVSELTEEEWELSQAYFKFECAYCGKKSKLTKDHLDPLKNKGLLTASNIIPACSSCNSSKKDKQWQSWFSKQKFYDKKRAEKIVDYVNFILSLPVKSDDDELGELVVTKEVVKQVPPNPTSIIFWSKNKRPDKWRDKIENRISIDGEKNKFDDIVNQLGGEGLEE
ncbi:HNH endonuclease [Enterococcus sp. AZ103]|uniref:HNH endonuclease n=1 Tax=Enterococcus sp. AZ103 TaxID=2774628 RepID=UPI003F21E0C2